MKPRLLVLGATGLTGQQLITRALEQGHDVTALVRDPSKLTIEHARLRTIAGSATAPDVVNAALKGQDAVLCALGTRSPTSLVRCDLMRTAIRALIPAMKHQAVNRLILLSALGVGQSADYAPPALRMAFRTAFRQVGKDKAAAEEHLRASDIDWTIVYPPSLTNGPQTNDYRSRESVDVKGMPKISRADIAHFMLTQLTDATYTRKIAIVTPH